jgi:hypothetical protein
LTPCEWIGDFLKRNLMRNGNYEANLLITSKKKNQAEVFESYSRVSQNHNKLVLMLLVPSYSLQSKNK